MTRKLYVKSYGCQMNVYDSHRMADTLAPEGFVETATPDDADLIILNTCHIREKAADKLYSELGRMRELKEQAARPGPPRHARGRRLRRAGRRQGDRPPQRRGRSGVRPAELSPPAGSAGARRQRCKVVDTEFPAEDKFDHLAAPSRAAMRKRGVSAFVTVQEGCDKFCTFCVVPYTRGAEVSRPVAKIVAEAERLADAGVREITLIGQNVNAYHGEGPDGGTASRSATCCIGSPRCRASRGCATPRAIRCDMDDSLIAAHRDLPALMPHLHLPVQSGSDHILAAMNRRHTRADYLQRRRSSARARSLTSLSRRTSSSVFQARPTRISSDTFDLVAEVGFASAYSFKYSPRPGTPAAEMDQIAGGREGRAAAAAAV